MQIPKPDGWKETISVADRTLTYDPAFSNDAEGGGFAIWHDEADEIEFKYHYVDIAPDAFGERVEIWDYRGDLQSWIYQRAPVGWRLNPSGLDPELIGQEPAWDVGPEKYPTVPLNPDGKIGASETERKAQELLYDYHRLFFNGEVHLSPLTGEYVVFPVTDVFFNQSQLPKEAVRGQVHYVFTEFRPREEWLDRTIKRVTTDCTISIFVRIANQGAQANKADHDCRRLADQVKEIFQAQDRSALAAKGIRHLKVLRGPVPVGTVGYQVRLIILGCQLQYKIPRTIPT
jgi:hypothetical protein